MFGRVVLWFSTTLACVLAIGLSWFLPIAFAIPLTILFLFTGVACGTTTGYFWYVWMDRNSTKWEKGNL